MNKRWLSVEEIAGVNHEQAHHNCDRRTDMLTKEHLQALMLKDVAVVEVQPADMPPVRYKGRVHIRVGPRRGFASEQEERLLSEKRTARMRAFDAQPCRGCALEDLVMDLFLVTYRTAAIDRAVIEENNRDVKEQLASLRFYDLGADCPTHAGVLLFAKDPLRWVPGAYVQFVRWAGTTMSDEPRDDKRNPVIAEAMSTLGYVNAYGRGVVRSQDALRKNGSPPAEFITDEPTQFLATIRRKL